MSAHLRNLLSAILLLQSEKEAESFFRDLCTPAELHALAERWHVCQLLATGEHSYRAIHEQTGASLTTISRVARFLKDEPYRGYRTMLKKISSSKSE